MAGRTHTIIGFGIVVPDEVFGQVFPHAYPINENGEREIDTKILKQMKTDQVDFLPHSDNLEIFIVSTGYVNTLDSPWIVKIPYQQMLQKGQVLVPEFQKRFPGYEPGIYAFTDTNA